MSSKNVKKRDAKASKALIINSAIELFSKKGYASTSMEELAKLSGLNKAMVFYYFKNKKGLYEAVMAQIFREIHHKIIQENQRCNTSIEELESFIRTYAKYACSHPYLPSLLLKELSDSGAVLPDMLFGAMRELFALFSDILKRGKEQGHFGDTIPMILYFMVIGTVNLMVTTKPLRVEASKKDDILLDTCANCNIDEIADYIVENIDIILKEKR